MFHALRGFFTATLLLVPAAALATRLPLSIEGSALNLSVQLQPEFLVTEAGAPAGDSASYDLFARRTRIQLSGDVTRNFGLYVQVDNPNFGKFGNFRARLIVQDARVAWTPTGTSGGTALLFDAGLMQIPLAHYVLGSSTNYVAVNLQTDALRMPRSTLPARRDTGVQVRGWALQRKLGFRAGVFEGYTPAAAPGCSPATPGTCITPRRNPAVRAFVNYAILGHEEGGYYYTSYRWSKNPVVSVGVAANYQSRAVRNAFGSLADNQVFAGDVYLDLPSGDSELVGEVTAFLNGNGTGSKDTGLGVSANLGYRFGALAPYVAYDYFDSAGCDGQGLSTAQLATCNATVHTADSRNFKAGLNFFINKNLNHVMVEFQVNHGFSAYGPSSITASTAGYVPLSLDPVSGSPARRPFTNSLAAPAYKSLLVHWNFVF